MFDDDDDKPKRGFDDHAHPPQHATCASIGLTVTVKEGSGDDQAYADAFIADADAYLKNFAATVMDGERGTVCFHCGEALTGMMATFLAKGGGFQWGIAHGEGFCGNCHWPARGHHFAKRPDGSDLFTLRNFVLSYHPDCVKPRTETTDADQAV